MTAPLRRCIPAERELSVPENLEKATLAARARQVCIGFLVPLPGRLLKGARPGRGIANVTRIGGAWTRVLSAMDGAWDARITDAGLRRFGHIHDWKVKTRQLLPSVIPSEFFPGERRRGSASHRCRGLDLAGAQTVRDAAAKAVPLIHAVDWPDDIGAARYLERVVAALGMLEHGLAQWTWPGEEA